LRSEDMPFIFILQKIMSLRLRHCTNDPGMVGKWCSRVSAHFQIVCVWFCGRKMCDAI
jgi:hypothetical protein